MNQLYHMFIGKIVLVCLDDIPIFSKHEEEHVQHFKQVLKLLRGNWFYAKIVVLFWERWIALIKATLSAKRALRWDLGISKLLQSGIDLFKLDNYSRSWGFAYFHKFNHGYITPMTPLISLTWSKTRYIWVEECERALKNVKFVVTHASILTLSKLREPFEVVNDASMMGVGVIALQEGRPTAFESTNFSFVERSSTTKEQELALVVHAMQT